MQQVGKRGPSPRRPSALPVCGQADQQTERAPGEGDPASDCPGSQPCTSRSAGGTARTGNVLHDRISMCECVCECVCVCETESACVGICVQQRRGPSRTSTRAPAPAGSGEMKPQPWFSPRGFHWGRNLFSWGRKPACPELSTLDSLSSANSYCEVNVQRSGQFYV